MVKLFVSFH